MFLYSVVVNVKYGLLILIGVVLVGVFFWQLGDSVPFIGQLPTHKSNNTGVPARIAQFDTDVSKRSVSFDQLLSGGPGKDGIPALRYPEFISIAESEERDETLGVLLEFEGEKKFYPFSILVWHEIVNDRVGEQDVVVTFCPLCASSIVFDPDVRGMVLEFGVSGLLYESNLVMYDRQTETLWSQAGRVAIVGDLLGTELEVLPFSQITFAKLRENYPDALVLSRDTGHFRNYDNTPYSGYEDTEEVYFPISVRDNRYHAKEVMYVLPVEDVSVAFPQQELEEGESQTFEIRDKNLTAVRGDVEIIVTDAAGNVVPGYYEMWFSWATHHQEDGVVWNIKE